MALPPGTTEEAFLREVDEEMRRDLAMGIWQRWGKWILGAVVVGLLAFAGYLYFQNRGERVAGKQGEQLDAAMTALAENQAAKAEPELAKLAASSEVGYKALAGFAQAQALVAKDDFKGAASKLGALAGDTTLPKPFRDEALVRQTLIEFDQIKPEEVIGRLQGLAVPDSEWFGTAGEMVAAAYLKQGKREQAGKLFGQIAQSRGAVPDSIRQRAVQMAGVLGVDAIDQTQEKKAQ